GLFEPRAQCRQSKILTALLASWLWRIDGRTDGRRDKITWRGKMKWLHRVPKVSWKRLIKIRLYIRSSLWIVPFLAIPLELALSRILHWLDDILGWSFLDCGLAGARETLDTIVTANLSFVVFTFGSLLVAIQVAGA